MLGLTKQEKQFIIVLIVSFISGICLNYYQKRNIKTGPAWREKQEFEINTLFEVATNKHNEEIRTTGIDNLSANQNELTKRSLVEKININTASHTELQLLPQIGPVLAGNIIEYRNRFGPFKTIKEIQKVKKIGIKTFNKIEKSITVK